MTQYQDARAQGRNTEALEKQINEQLNGVLPLATAEKQCSAEVGN